MFERIDFPAFLADLRARYSSPEYQATAAEYRAEEAARLKRAAHDHYERQCERLSPFHAAAVLASCTPALAPLTTTELQRKVIEQWDGEEHLFLLGSTAIGKTYTATWCAMRRALRGGTVASVTATRVCEASPDRLTMLRGVDVLVLDQLHTLRSPAGKDVPAWRVAPVVDLIDWRYEHMSTTIAAGTVEAGEMTELLGADVRRRFPLRLSADTGEVRKK